jgi:hypothetical protein
LLLRGEALASRSEAECAAGSLQLQCQTKTPEAFCLVPTFAEGSIIPSKLCSQRLILQSTCYADRDDADQTTSFRTAEPRKHSTFSPKVHNNAPRAPSKGLQTQRCRSGGYRKVIYRSARLACTSCRPFSSLSQDALRSR